MKSETPPDISNFDEGVVMIHCAHDKLHDGGHFEYFSTARVPVVPVLVPATPLSPAMLPPDQEPADEPAAAEPAAAEPAAAVTNVATKRSGTKRKRAKRTRSKRAPPRAASLLLICVAPFPDSKIAHKGDVLPFLLSLLPCVCV